MDSPFDTFGAVNRRRAMFANGSAYPDPGYVPADPTQPDENSYTSAPDQQQALTQEGDQAGQQMLAQQQKQATANAQADQKAQTAQAKTDQANWQDQAKVDGANAKQDGVITRQTTIPGPDGKDINVQAYTQNPDGTTAYQPKDLGSQAFPDGSTYRVQRDQWGRQVYSDAYAPENANLALKNGQVIATSKVKGVPTKDVSSQGVTIDPSDPQFATDGSGQIKQGGITVAPNAPQNDPKIQAAVNAEEQKLITGNADGTGKTGAAGQQVGDTVGSDADDATQKATDANADYTEAQAQHHDAIEGLKAASDPAAAGWNMDKLQVNVKAAQDELNRSQAALMTAAQNKAATKTAADAATATAKKAKADPLGYLQDQADAASRAQQIAAGNLSPNGAATPQGEGTVPLPPPGAAQFPSPAVMGQQPPNQPDATAGVIPDLPGLTPAEQAARRTGITSAAQEMQGDGIDPHGLFESGGGAPSPSTNAAAGPDNTDPNSISGLILGKYGQPPPDQSGSGPTGNPVPSAPPPGATPAPKANPDGSVNLYRPGSVVPIGTMADGSYTPAAQQPPPPGGLMQPSKPFVGPEAPAHSILDLSDNVTNSIVHGLASSTIVPLARAQAIAHNLIMTGHGPQLPNPNDGWGGGATQSEDDRMANAVSSFAENGGTPMKNAGRLGNLLTRSVPSVGASTVGTIAVAGGDPLAMAGLMGLGGGTDGYYDAIAKGADPKKALAAGGYGLVVNTAMGLAMGPASRTAARLAMGRNAAAFLQGAYRPTVTEAAKFIGADGGAQAMLGAGTQLGTNAAAKTLYDPNRPLSDGVASAAVQQGAFAALHFPTVATALLDSTTRGAIQRDALNLASAVDQLHASQVAGGQSLDQVNAYRLGQLKSGMEAISANDALAPEAKQAARMGVATAWAPMNADEFQSLQANPDGSLQASPAKIQAAADRVNQLQGRLQKRVGNILENASKPTPADKAEAASLIPPDVQQKQTTLDQFNSTRPEGTAPATTDTLQLASDVSPLTHPGSDVQPVAEHYVPVAHQIEQLPDPDAQTAATAMLKIANGRALNSDEQSTMLGDPTTGQPGAVDATTNQPLVTQGDGGKLLLTDAGLDRMKTLVPAAADILPRSEQAQKEAPQPLPPPTGKKAAQAAQPAIQSAPDSDSAPRIAAGPPDPDLAHLDDETLQVQHNNLAASQAKAQAGGGSLPPNALNQLTKRQVEIARRQAVRNQIQGDDGSGGGGPSPKEGDEVSYSRVNGDGRTVQSRGEITSTGPGRYKVIDADDGIERSVPVSNIRPSKPVLASEPAEAKSSAKNPVAEPAAPPAAEKPQAKGDAEGTLKQAAPAEYPDDALRTRVNGLRRAVAESDSPVAKDRLAEAQAELHAGRAARGENIDVGAEARKLGVNIIGDPDQISPEHREIVMRAVNEFSRYKKAFASMGVHSIRLVDDFDGAGMMVVNRGADDTEFHLNPDRLAHNWDGTPSPKTWLPKLVSEEYIHAATFGLLSKDFHAMGLSHEDWAPFLNSHLGKMAKELEQAHNGNLAAEVRDQYGKVNGLNLVLEFTRREVQKRLLGSTTEDTFRGKPYTASFLRRLLTFIKAKFGLQKDVPPELRRMIGALEAVTGDALKANGLPLLTSDERAGRATDNPRPQAVNEDEDLRARAIGADLTPGQRTILPSGRVVARDNSGNLVMRQANPDGVSERRLAEDAPLGASHLTTPQIKEILQSHEQPELSTGKSSHARNPEEPHSGDGADQGTAEAGRLPSSGDPRQSVAPQQSVRGPQAGGAVGGRESVSASSLGAERPAGAAGEQSSDAKESASAGQRANSDAGSESVERSGATGRSNDATGDAGSSGATEQRGRNGARTLPPLDTGSGINRGASTRASGGIEDDGLFPETGKSPKTGALFVGKDGGRATITRISKSKFLASYRDSGQRNSWKTSSFSSLDSAVKNVTGRGFYYFGKEDAALVDRLGSMTPGEVSSFVQNPRHVEEDQLHVALASLTDQGKHAQADAVQRELEFRQEERERTQHEQDQADAIHEHLGPSLAEHVAARGGLPKPGTPAAGELGAIKPNVRIDQKRIGSAGAAPRVGTEYSQLYDAYRSLMNTPLGELNRYQQNLKRKFARNPLFTDEAKQSSTDMAQSVRGGGFRTDGTDLDDQSFIAALRDDIEGTPHYPSREAGWEGHAAQGAAPVRTPREITAEHNSFDQRPDEDRAPARTGTPESKPAAAEPEIKLPSREVAQKVHDKLSEIQAEKGELTPSQTRMMDAATKMLAPNEVEHGSRAVDGAVPYDRAQQAAWDYLDKNAELPPWLHGAIGKLFRNALRAGGNAVGDLINRLKAVPRSDAELRVGGAPALGRTLHEVDRDFPTDHEEMIRDDTGFPNDFLRNRAKAQYMAMPNKVVAADGSEIRMKEPDAEYANGQPTGSKSVSGRLLHLITAGDRQTIHNSKAAVFRNTPTTLRSAAVRLHDQDSGNRIYVKQYRDGTKHMVVVSPDGAVEDQKPFTGSLLTQFPAGSRTGRRDSMPIDWVRKKEGSGQSQGNPVPTPPDSTRPGTRPEEFQSDSTVGKGGNQPDSGLSVSGASAISDGPPLSEKARNIQKILDGMDARVANGEELPPGQKGAYPKLTQELRREQNLPSGDYFDTPLFARQQTEAREAGPDVDALFNNHLPIAKGVARSYRIPGLDPADVDQEASVALLKAARTYDSSQAGDGRGFPAYAKTVIKNHLTDVFRKRALRREDTTLDAPLDHEGSDGETGTAQVRDGTQDTNRAVQKRELGGALRNEVSSLPDAERNVMARMLDGKSGAEIARELDVSPQRISTLFQNARDRLRQRLEALGHNKADIRDLAVRGARPFEHDYDDQPLHVMDTPEQRKFASDAFGFRAFAEHDVVPAAKAVADTFKKAGDSILKVFAPTLRSSEAAKFGRSLRANLAWAAHEGDMVYEAMRQARSHFQGKTVAECHDFIHAVETDTPIKDPELAEIYQQLRSLNRARVDLARSMPQRHFTAYLENYHPHIWKDDPETQAAALKYYQRKIEGNRSFLKHRTIPTVDEGLHLGLKLVSDNPVDLFLLKFSQMDKYVAGQRILEEGKQTETFLPFDRPEDAPLGYRRIDPRIGLSTEFRPDPEANPDLPGIQGAGRQKRVDVHYYAPDEVCQVLENHLSPGLRNSPHEMVRTPYKIIMGVANTLNQAQLGMSAFHLGFTTYDTLVSQLALATRQAVPQSLGGLGQPVEAAKNLATLPFTPFTNYLKGSKLLKEWMAPGTQGDEVNRIMESAIQGGARVKQGEIYSDGWTKAFHKAFTQGNLPGMTWRAPFAAIEFASKPILEHLVPRQKLGVFFSLMHAELKNLGPDATTDQLRQVAQRNWASVDNRMGQLAYDNLFWSKTAKDLAMMVTRSVGWNLGTFREIGGSIPDTGAYIRDLMSGKHPQFTNRMAYTIALNTMTPALGSLFCYLLTGKGPSSLYDAYFPPTGEKDANGHDARVAGPSYAKDEFATAHDPVGTTENKTSPIWASSLQLLHNKDYWGTQIVAPDDPWWKQAASVAKFAATQVEPFSFSGGNQFAQDIPPGDNVGPLRKLIGSKAVHTMLGGLEIPKSIPLIGGAHVLGAPTFGFTPAPKYMSESAAELRAQELEDRLHAGDLKTSAEAAKNQTRSTLRTLMAQNAPNLGAAIQDAIKSGVVTPKQLSKLQEEAQLSPLQRMAKNIAMEYQMKSDPVAGYQALRSVWDKGTVAEQQKLAPYIFPLYSDAFKVAGAKIGPPPKVLAETKPPAELSMAQ